MKYVANPVVVDAYRIAEVHASKTRGMRLNLESGDVVCATPEMTSRMTPVAGDYWVIQSDGYVYLNPKDVFERKYRPVEAARAAS